ncbi:MAG: hypothetical protein JW394_0762 [Nitrospira sp.]|nr:hypothetical protein [Nitrospira sp.]
MARTTLIAPPICSAMVLIVTPATIETTRDWARAGPTSLSTAGSVWGFTAKTTTLAQAVASRLAEPTRTPNWLFK